MRSDWSNVHVRVPGPLSSDQGIVSWQKAYSKLLILIIINIIITLYSTLAVFSITLDSSESFILSDRA